MMLVYFRVSRNKTRTHLLDQSQQICPHGIGDVLFGSVSAPEKLEQQHPQIQLKVDSFVEGNGHHLEQPLEVQKQSGFAEMLIHLFEAQVSIGREPPNCTLDYKVVMVKVFVT